MMDAFGRAMRYIFTHLICLTFLTFDLGHSVSFMLEHDPIARDFAEYLDLRTSEFMGNLHQTFDQHSRHKREISEPEYELTWRIESLLPIAFDGATVIEHFYVDGDNYIIVGKSREGDSYQAKAVIYRYDDGPDAFIDTGLSITTYGLSDISSHLIGDYIYLAVANQQSAANLYNGHSHIYRFNHQTNALNFYLQMFTEGASDMEFFEYEGDVYLAVVNMRSDYYKAYRAEMQVYKYGTTFTLVTSVETFGATSVASFEIDETLYLAVAQYEDNNGNVDVGTNVYYFNTESSELFRVQTLESSSAVHVAAFTMYGHPFLVVANYREVVGGLTYYDTTSTVYWWEGDQFWPYQSLPTNGPTHFEHIELSDEIHLLAITNSKQSGVEGSTVFYQYDDYSGDWVETSQQILYDDGADDPVTVTLMPVAIGDEILLALANSGLNYSESVSVNNTNFYRFSFFNDTVAAEDAATQRASGDCLDAVHAEVAVAMHNLTSLKEHVDDSMSLTLDQNITTPIVIIGNITIEDILTVTENITVKDEYEYVIDPELFKAIENNRQRMQNLSSDVDNFAVTLDGYQIVEGAKVFQQTVIVTNLTDATYLTTLDGHIGNLDLENLNDTVIRVTGAHQVDGSTTFSGAVSVLGNLNMSGLVNGMQIPDDILTLDTDQNSTATLTFDNSVAFYSDVVLEGDVNGFDLHQDVITTVNNHTISGLKVINGDVESVKGVRIIDGATISGVDVSELRSRVVLVSEGGIIAGDVEFNGDVTVGDVTIVSGLVNGVNITELAGDIVYVDTDQTISAPKTFTKNVSIDGNLAITGSVNDIDISEGVISTTTDQMISADIKLVSVATVTGDVTVTGTVNGVDLSADAVTQDGDQTVAGPVSFSQDLTVSGDIDMADLATIGGVDISELDGTTVKINGMDQTVAGAKTFVNAVSVTGDASVSNFINRFNLTKLAASILSMSRPQTFDLPTEITGHVTLQGAVTLNDTVDGYQVPDDFVLLDQDGNIFGHKTFWAATTIDGSLNLTLGQPINGVNLTTLDKEVLRTVGNQTVQGPVNFTSDLYVKGHVDVDGMVNGMLLSRDLVSLDTQQTISGIKMFRNASLNIHGDLTVNDINIMAGMISNVDVLALLENAVLNDHEDSVIYGLKTFQTIEVSDDVTIHGLINGVDIVAFALNVATLTADQTITGNITFLSDLKFDDDITVQDTVTGIYIETTSALIVLKHTNGTIYGAKHYSSDVTISGDVTVDGLVNGIDITDLQLVYLSQTVPQSISVKTTFLQNIHLDNLYLCDMCLLDGVDTSFMALINANEVFTVSLTFDAEVIVNGNVTIGGLVDNVDISKLSKSAVRISGPYQVAFGVKRFKSVNVDGNITMMENATVNGIDVSELGRTIVRTDGNQTVNLYTVFEKPVHIHGNLESYDLVGPVHLRFMLEDAVFFNTTEAISGNKLFTAPLYIADLDIDGDLQTDVTQGMASLVYVLDNTVTMTTDQTVNGDVTFSQDLNVVGDIDVNDTSTVDKIDLSEYTVLTISNQTILKRVIFTSGFEINSDMSVTGLVDTADIEILANTLVSLSEEQTIEGAWTFMQNLNILGDVTISGHVNDITVRSQLVTLADRQSINRIKTFTGNVTVDDNMNCDELNGENLVDFAADMVTHDDDFEITGEKTFKAPVSIQDNITVTGYVDGINITQMYLDHFKNADYILEQMASTNLTLRTQCPGISSLKLASLGQPLLFSHYEDYQHFTSSSVSFFNSIPYEGLTLLAMSETANTPFEGCIATSLYLCPELDPCWLVDDTLGSASSVQLFAFNQTTFVVVTRSAQSMQCVDEVGSMTLTQVLILEDGDFVAEISSNSPVDSAMFEIEGDIYLAVANFEISTTGDQTVNSTIHKYNATSATFDLHQTVLTQSARAVSYLEHDGNHWLSWANQNTIISWWNSTEQEFQTSALVPTEYASDVVSFIVNDSPYIAVADEKGVGDFGGLNFNKPVKLFNFVDGQGWIWKQDIAVLGVVDLDVFAIDDLAYLVMVSQHFHTIHVYQWNGVSLFELYFTLPIEGAVHAHPFVHVGDLYMTVARPVTSQFALSSRTPIIMEAIVKGQQPTTVFTTQF